MSKNALLLGLTTALLSTLPAQTPPTTARPVPPVELKFGSFDPATQSLAVPALLQARDAGRLWIVQFEDHPTEAMRTAVRAGGAEVHGYLPENAYVVRAPRGAAAAIGQQPEVRSVTGYHPAFRLEAVLRAELLANAAPKRRYNIVVVDKHTDKPALARNIRAIGGRVDDEGGGSLLFQATLDGPQLLQAAGFDEVLWIDRWGAPEDDMDNARIQGGGNYVETAGGYTGLGITGHQMEGLNPSHPDWNNTPIGFPSGCTSSSGHGHNTAGIVYGNGTSSPSARGMAPDAQAVFSSCRTNRYNNFQSLIATHRIMFTTASWGSPRTRLYTSVSAEADDICFDQDIIWTNSQSNAGNQDSRAEAWAKNVFACGGVNHANNSNPLDDSWQRGNASRGPAADGRMKPDFCAYYDNIATSSSGGGFTSSFGGTSGATPIVAGHNALAIQMFTDGAFGNALRVQGGTRFQNKPRFPTLKALQAVNAEQYAFTSTSTDNRREHQGWGFPNLRNMWDDRNVMFIVDEEDVIQQGEAMSYVLAVPAARSELNISMSYSDPAGNPAAAIARINDLTLRAISPSGVVYLGNVGLEDGTRSTAGGSRDRLNTIENVFVTSPEAGNWTVDVIAYIVAQDAHVETPTTVDADFGLVARGATLVSRSRVMAQVGSIAKFGVGCVGTGRPAFCLSRNENGGTLTQVTRQWEYGYEVTARSAVSVTGFDLWTQSTSSTSTRQRAAIYGSTNGRPNAAPIATSVMQISSTAGFHTATFSPAIPFAAGETFYLAVTHGNITYISDLTAGTQSPVWVNDSSGWSVTALADQPSFRVLCQGGSMNVAPQFDLTGVPEIGRTLTASLIDAAPNAPVVLLIGFSNTALAGGASLPAALAPIGAPGCSLYVRPDVPTSLTADGSGRASTTIAIAPDPALGGLDAYAQFFVIDPGANTLGLATSEANAIVIGN